MLENGFRNSGRFSIHMYMYMYMYVGILLSQNEGGAVMCILIWLKI